MRQLVDMLNRWGYEYHILGKPTVPDSVYDAHYQQLLKMEADNPDSICADSPTQNVGSNSVGCKIIHKLPMQSLDNTFTIEATCNWFLKSNSRAYTNEPKIDGLAVSLIYKNGVLTQAATRGNGIKGENILHHARAIPNIPQTLNVSVDHLEIRGEICLPKEAFNLYNEKNPQKPFANARNAASGIIRHQNVTDLTPSLMFLCHSISECSLELPDSYYDTMQLFSSWGIPIIPQLTVTEPESCPLYYTSMQQHRDLLPFDIDGVVFKVDSRKAQTELGSTNRSPKWAIAFKFPAQELPSKLIAIDVQIGRTGVITPVARINPIQLCGVEVSNVTLHNFDNIRLKDIRVGDTIIVKRAGDVIPDVVGVIKDLRLDKTAPFQYPTTCPCCGSPTKIKGAFLYCTGTDCPDTLIAKLAHYIHKSALNMSGLGIELMRQLVTTGLVKDISDLYTLTSEQLCTLKGITPRSASKILGSIEKSKTTTLEQFLYGLGIDNIGKSLAAEIAKYDINLLLEMDLQFLTSIPTMSEARIENVTAWLNHKPNIDMVKRILGLGLVFKNVKPLIQGQQFENQSFVITGTFPIPRTEIQQLIESHNGVVSNAVNKGTSFLVQGDNSGSKTDKALKFGIPIISLNELQAMITR